MTLTYRAACSPHHDFALQEHDLGHLGVIGSCPDRS
jgi:hypothetical protein